MYSKAHLIQHVTKFNTINVKPFELFDKNLFYTNSSSALQYCKYYVSKLVN